MGKQRGDIPRVTDASWHCSKVWEAWLGPGGVVAQVPQGLSKEKAVMTGGREVLGLQRWGSRACRKVGAMLLWGFMSQKCTPGDGHLATLRLPTPSSFLQHPAKLGRPCTSHSLGDQRSAAAGQGQHDRWRGTRVPQAHSSGYACARCCFLKCQQCPVIIS